MVDGGGDDRDENSVELVRCRVFAGLRDDGDRLRKRAQNADRGVLGILAFGEVTAQNGVRVVESSVAYLIKVALVNRDGNDIVIDVRISAHVH